MARKMTVKLRVELEVDVDAYLLTYGVEPERIPSDVVDYMVELAGYCAAADEGCWTVKAVRTVTR